MSGVTPSRAHPAIRVAAHDDVPELMRIRSAVRENVLADRAKVPASAYYDLLSRARIWLWDEDGVRGFCAADPSNGTVWALFVDPRHEGLGIGRQLLAMGSRDVWEAGLGGGAAIHRGWITCRTVLRPRGLADAWRHPERRARLHKVPWRGLMAVAACLHFLRRHFG